MRVTPFRAIIARDPEERGMSSDEERIARAGDYILGAMDDTERERAERDLERDPAFREAVMRLSAQLRALGRARPASSAERLWATVEARIAELPQMRAITGSHAASSAVRWISPASLGGWRGALVAMGLMLACGLGYLAGITSAPPTQPVAIAVLDAAEAPVAILEAHADHGIRVVPLAALSVPNGKVMEVWTLYDRAVGPVSLGTMLRAVETHIVGPRLPAPRPGQIYEITLEEAPRSATGRPTGHVLASGVAQLPTGR